VLGWLCLGIPFFFADRHGYQRYDEEGALKSAGSMLVLGASVCLVVSQLLLGRAYHPDIHCKTDRYHT
jgi:hypothetical protein